MKYDFLPSSASGWAEIVASPVESDGYPPLFRFRFQAPVESVQIDRLAVGASLLFSPWSSGHALFPAGLSVLTARRLTEWSLSLGHWVSATPIRRGGILIPKGRNTLSLDELDNGKNCTYLGFVDSEDGSSILGKSIRIASNLAIFEASAPSLEYQLLIRLGAATLLSELLGANEIHFSKLYHCNPNSFESTRRLLECVSLGLVKK